MKKEYKSLTEELNRIKELSGVKLDEGIFNTKKISVAAEGQFLIGKVLDVKKSDTGMIVTTDKFTAHIDDIKNKIGYIIPNHDIRKIDLPQMEVNHILNQVNKLGL